MPTRRASLLLLAGAFVCATGCDGSSTVIRLRSTSSAGRVGSDGGEGGEGGAVDVASGGSGAKGGSGARPGAGGTASSEAGGGGKGARGGTGATGGKNTSLAAGGSGAAAAGGGGGTTNEADDAGTGDAPGAGGAAPSDQLSLCIRLGTSSVELNERVALDFEDAFYADCNINWVFDLYEDESKNLHQRDRFLSQVGRFDYALWGCLPLTPAPDSFDLIYTPQPLTQADVNALIDAYVHAATADLSMSPDEIAAMRAILVRLSEPLLISPDPGGYSRSRCNATGGVGGAAGAGGESGAAGESGQVASGGAPASGGVPASGQAGTGHGGAG